MIGLLIGFELFYKKFDLLLVQVIYIEVFYYYCCQDGVMIEEQFSVYCVEELEKLIVVEGVDIIVVFIGELVLGMGGIVLLFVGYWDVIQKVLDRYDILLIVDEVVMGFGWLGLMFGFDYYGMCFDIIIIVKGLISVYVLLLGSIIGQCVWDVLMQGIDENGVLGYGWIYFVYLIGVVVGIVNL